MLSRFVIALINFKNDRIRRRDMLNALAEGGERERMFIVILYGGGKPGGI